MMTQLVEFVVRVVLVLGLTFAAYHTWLYLMLNIKGTPFADFRTFLSVIGVFVLLIVADLVISFLQRMMPGKSS